MKNDLDLRVKILHNPKTQPIFYKYFFKRPIVESSLYKTLCKFLNHKPIIRVQILPIDNNKVALDLES